MPRKPASTQLCLFESITPVTYDDVFIWLERVPRIDCTSPRARQYFHSYRVADKIRAHKERGDFNTALGVANHDATPKSLHVLTYGERVAFFKPPELPWRR